MRTQVKCPWSRSGSFCYEHRCPLDNRRFSEELDKWALIGRTPRALNPEPSPGGGFDAEWGMLRKCRINSLFQDPQTVIDWMLTGKAKMTSQVCQELIGAEQRYRDTLNEEAVWRMTGQSIVEFIRTNKEFRAWCRKRRLEPIGKRVVKWLKKYGLARTE